MNPKKLSIFAIVLCMLFVPMAVLAGCCKHEHVFSAWVEIEEANCTEGGGIKA